MGLPETLGPTLGRLGETAGHEKADATRGEGRIGHVYLSVTLGLLSEAPH
jgi:hypothetical protein